MSNYFARHGDIKDYFSEALTSSAPVKTATDALKRQSADEARTLIEKVISSYGSKKSNVVIRRYGIK